MNMKERLDKIKLVFADVDNTLLCLRMYDANGQNDKDNGERIVGVYDGKEWLRYNVFTNAYLHCTAPVGMTKVIYQLHNNGAKIYGLTECGNSFEYNAKYNRLRECYQNVFEHHGDLISVDSRSKKVMVMQLIAERDEVALDEILFIDDSYSEVLEAFHAGILSMHTTEALELLLEGETQD